MFRTITLLAALASTIACRDHDGVAASTSLGITSVTTWTPGGSSTSTASSSTGTGTSAGAGSTTTGTTTTTTTTGTSTTGTSDGVGSTTDPGPGTTTDPSTGSVPPDPVQECLAMVDPGDECTACICTDCLELWDTCHEDEGCAAIQACSQKDGCYTIDCTDKPCSLTIDWYGGIGMTSFKELWMPLSQCLRTHCRHLCPW